MSIFMSKEKKALKAKMELRRSVSSLKKWERGLEKKKAEMIKLGQMAKSQGIKDQYALAVSGLKTIMSQLQRSKKMQLQLSLVETMRDLSSMSAGFVGIMGKVGNEIQKITGNSDFMKNQMKFEQGMMTIDDMMGQLESFMDDSGDSLLSGFEDNSISDADIEAMLDITAPASNPVNPVVENLMKEIEAQKQIDK